MISALTHPIDSIKTNYAEPKSSFGVSRLTRFILEVFSFASLLPSVRASLHCGEFPGIHEIGKSPVYGNRNWEIQKITNSPFLPLFEKFADNFYGNNQFRFFARGKDDPENCAPFADAALTRYIEKYAKYNCTEGNIFDDRPYFHGEHKSSVKVLTPGRVQIVTSPYFAPTCQRKKTCSGYFPSFHSLSKYHELMHAEEQPYLESMQFSMELLTTLKQHILTDLVLKQCYSEEKESTVDYGKTLVLGNVNFPAGELANFYRRLEESYGSLAEAVVSAESIAYLMGHPHYQKVIETIQKYPGSKLAAKKARTCLDDKNYYSHLIALSVMPGMFHKKQYIEAFRLIVKSLENHALPGEFFPFVQDFIQAGEYELAAHLITKGLENSRLYISLMAIGFAKDLFKKEENLDRIFGFAMLALEHKEDEVQKKGIQLAELLIEHKKYDQAFKIAMEGLSKFFPQRVQAHELALQFVEHGERELAFQMIVKSIEALDVEVISDLALQKLIASEYKTEELLEISQSTLSNQNASFVSHLLSMNKLVSTIKDLKEALVFPPYLMDQGVWEEGFQLAMYALDQTQPEIQRQALSIAIQLIDSEKYDQAFKIAMKGLENPSPDLRLKSHKLAFAFVRKEQLGNAFQMIMKSLKQFDFESIPMKVVDYLFRIQYRKLEDFLTVVESIQSRDDLPLEVKNNFGLFVHEIQNIQESCKNQLVDL